MKSRRWIASALLPAFVLLSITCGDTRREAASTAASDQETSMQQRLNKYTPFRLETDLSALTEKQRQMLPLLIDAARIMDGLFWKQTYGDRQQLLDSILDPEARRFAEINYGPWDRLEGDEPFLAGVGPKPPGANLYPANITKEEFEVAAKASADGGTALRSLYTIVRRDSEGKLSAIPYREAFAVELSAAAAKLREASKLAEDAGLKRYLELRADALETDNYQPSDFAWMEMKGNTIDIVIGPIETYDDKLYGYKASFEAYVLIKDKEWSGRLARYAEMLPELQRGLPVSEEYKRESPGTDSDLNAYDAIYYAGDCNAGSKTIAINLPNDEEVQMKRGARRLQLKNAMRAKFEKIVVPIAGELIAEDQRGHITFDAFFANTMFHEVAHGLGIKNTITGKGTVREALKEQSSALEEGKADILGLYMVTKLFEEGELTGGAVEDNYTTFLTGIFRSIRFGASSAHGVANLLRFNFFKQAGAFSRDDASGTYRVNAAKMKQAISDLSAKILKLQGDGDYQGVAEFVEEMGSMDPLLESDLERLSTAGIPVDVVFEQGLD
jgi:hypothetical protein